MGQSFVVAGGLVDSGWSVAVTAVAFCADDSAARHREGQARVRGIVKRNLQVRDGGDRDAIWRRGRIVGIGVVGQNIAERHGRPRRRSRNRIFRNIG